jgi:hypothetical protein
MSEENLEIVRAAVDVWNRDDWDAAAAQERTLSAASQPAAQAPGIGKRRRRPA